jgi:hypothetical protein
VVWWEVLMASRKKVILAVCIGLLVMAAGGVITALSLGSSLKDRADGFFKLAASGDVQAAYENFTSDAFKKRTDVKGLQSFLSRLGISRYFRLATSEFIMKPTVAGWTGVVMAQDEPLAKVRILFVKEDGAWKIEGLKKLTGGSDESGTP